MGNPQDTLENLPLTSDVVVVGGGNAAFSAAHAAAERGRKVIMLEKSSEELAGGNSYYTAGATRIVHNGLNDLKGLIEEDERHTRTTVPPYSAEEYLGDLEKLTQGRNDPELSRVLVEEGQETLRWLNKLGLKYRLMYERQAYTNPDGTYLFWGGVHVGNVGGGEGLVKDHTNVARRFGVDIRYSHEATELLVENGRVVGVKGTTHGSPFEVRAESTVLAAGGFESNPEMREKYLGEGWARAKVRGTPNNQGTMLNAALGIGAAKAGDWNSAHSVQWDAYYPDNESNYELTNRLTRQGYFLGILVNNEGERFLDEGEDFRNYTYAKYGKVVLNQPDSIAFQIYDSKVRPLLRAEEYDMPGISLATADTIEDIALKIGVPVEHLTRTVAAYNSGINTDRSFDPTVKDGKWSSTAPPKSNWSSPLDTAPYYAYPVTCGITFTFGGLKTDTFGRVQDERGNHIPGLYAAGEMLGGLFSNNYPGGSGLAAGAVFGRRAGTVA
ncbi:FAD-dependent tricarballylate dehydrogenase TcuA [uncultured Arthrobacter sp.]|uniref:FAD-dependent tricarballylate dehydrogenase TcuA n=1 Tax=uncultured Arthrobacter sp. TaxID=114050 RepID=UPI0026172376|nr:FAD-dependent tricarballylate dehydrogenase TcuA [uncultured Arthrobacter sp.]